MQDLRAVPFVAALPAHAEEVRVASPQTKQVQKEAEKRPKAAEKEARRIAEETKKRLAVGRVGTI
jgi:hypothetical protein